MELELGLKIMQTRDDVSSTTDLRIAKDGGGVFLSRETESMFILTAHLKGYRKEHIDIKINEDGTRITIIGNKAVQEKVMLGWMLYKKEVELRGFKKAFIIPGGVVLDKIKAKFDEDEAILTVFMPKMVQGVSGHVIQEVEELEDDQGRVTKMDHKEIEEEQPGEVETSGSMQIASLDSELRDGESLTQEEMSDIGNKVQSEYPKDDKRRDISENTALVKSKPKKCKICSPAVAGSALLVSLVVLVIHLIRAKR